MNAWKLVSALAIFVLLAGRGQAQTTIFTATLTGAQEVPANASSGTGSGTLEFNNSTRAWSLSGTFSGLSGNANDAHIHGPAAAGTTAGAVVGITFTSGATSGTFSGSGTFSATQASDLLAELYYINIHSTAFAGGEIRGQLTAVPEPSTYALGLGVATLLAVAVSRRRRRYHPLWHAQVRRPADPTLHALADCLSPITPVHTTPNPKA